MAKEAFENLGTRTLLANIAEVRIENFKYIIVSIIREQNLGNTMIAS